MIPDGRQEVMGVFLQDEISPGSSVSLTPSLRADRFDSSASHLGLSSSASHVSPKMVLAWQAVEGLMVYGSYGEAFRAPTINELYSFISGRNYFNNFRSQSRLEAGDRRNAGDRGQICPARPAFRSGSLQVAAQYL